MDKYDLTGKTIIPFCTSGGTSINESIRDFRAYLPNSNVIDGKRLNVSDVESFVENLRI